MSPSQSVQKNTWSRRRFAQTLSLAPAFLRGARLEAADSLFPLGVASGDPDSSSVVLWTRLAPEPLSGGGLRRSAVAVEWEVASDEGMVNVIRRGAAVAESSEGHRVLVVATGLPADSWLYYRFLALGQTSRVGRTRTFPQPGQRDFLRFALASCQNYEAGYYAAYRDMVERDAPGETIDCVIHVGDYIYEQGASPGALRRHNGGEIFTVDDYRNRYALYRLDPHLQEAHARFPFLVTWDDHETDNNYAGRIPEEGAPRPEFFLERRANAYKVYSETMPLRPENRFDGIAQKLYRSIDFGGLARFHILDSRQYRTDQPASGLFGSTDPASLALEPVFGVKLYAPNEILNPAATMTGFHQQNWLFESLLRSRTKWNILAQQVVLARWNLGPAVGVFGSPLSDLRNVDAWDGYDAAQRRLLAFLAAARPSNPVVLTGDIHSAWASNLLADFDDPASDAVAAEFVCTSISSDFFGGTATHLAAQLTLPANPHIRHLNGLFRGYALCTVEPSQCVTEFRAVWDARDPSSPVFADRRFRLQAGFNARRNGGQALEPA